MSYTGYTDAIMLFGDSLTEAWSAGSLAQRMAEAYSRKLDVVNRGFGGYNSEWAISVFRQIIATKEHREKGLGQRIKLMTIWFGTNDSVLEGESQHVPLDKYKANLSHLVSLVRSPMSPYQDPQTRIVLITCPPVMEKAWTAHLAKVRLERGESDVDKPSRSKENARLYAQACKDVAEEEKLPVVDAHAEIIRAAGGDSEDQLAPFFTDGLHFTAEGYEVLFQALAKTIADSYPELDGANVQRRMPEWSDVAVDQHVINIALDKRNRGEL